MTLPNYRSQLTIPVLPNNFTPMQSVQLAVSNSGGTGSASKTFTIVPGKNQRVTFKICNTGQKTVYLATGIGSATAVASSGTLTPAASSIAVTYATCDCIPAGAILTQDYPPGTDTIAAICASTDTSTLEISIGYGQ